VTWLLLACASDTPTGPLADVVGAAGLGEAGQITMSVAIESPDTGCDQYAAWWEILDDDGGLVYRRILEHSHPDEQPFTRTGGPVPLLLDTHVWVRAWMHPTGYGGQAMEGSVGAGFTAAELQADWAEDLAEAEPLPEGCLF
jgi:hypothetical protein